MHVCPMEVEMATGEKMKMKLTGKKIGEAKVKVRIALKKPE